MQRSEVSGAVRLIYRSLGVKGLKKNVAHYFWYDLRTLLHFWYTAWWCLLYVVETSSCCHNRYNKSWQMTGRVFCIMYLQAQRRCHTLRKVSVNNCQPTRLNFLHERVLNGNERSGATKWGEFSANTSAKISFSRRTLLHKVGWATQWTDTFNVSVQWRSSV